MTTISGILIFDIDVSWSGYLPIIPGCNGCSGDDGTFTYTNNPEWYYTNNNTRVNVPFSFTDNGTTNSGFTFQNIPLQQQGRITKIVDFGGIPLSRAINQFKDGVNPYNGNFPDDVDNLPTLLSGTNVQNLFQGTNFNGNISLWDINIVNPKNLSGMFQNASNFNKNIGSWNITNIINMSNMLNNTALSINNYDATLNDWASQQVQNNVILGADGLEYSSAGEVGRNFLINEPNNWDIQGDTLIQNIGTLIYEITGTFNNNLPIINTDNSFLVLNSSINNNTVTVEYEYGEIINNDGLYLYNFNDYVITKITSFGSIPLSRQGNQFRDYQGTFPDDLNDTPTILNDTNGSHMFFKTVFSSGVGNWNVENITGFERAFQENVNFNEDLNNWNVSNVKNISYIFRACSSFNGNVSNWNVENVNNILFAFSECLSFNQQLNNWNVSNISDMAALFENCRVFNQNLNSWDMSNVRQSGRMFSGCISFNQPLNNWNVSNVSDMHRMFQGTSSFNQSLNNWNTSNVAEMRYMFSNCSIFNGDISRIQVK